MPYFNTDYWKKFNIPYCMIMIRTRITHQVDLDNNNKNIFILLNIFMTDDMILAIFLKLI